MPRHRRLELSGAVYHVISRGLEGRNIFIDENEREEFLRRLEKGLKETGSKCYGWVLMPNHFHLLIRTGKRSLSDLMRKLLPGYALYFNKRHKRSGYLYQSRYKSILCQEENYLLELVRYIHLNPLRGSIVKDLHGLDNYEWCGHSVLIGETKREWHSTGEVLERFGGKKNEAVRKYKKFIQDGRNMGKRDDLMGGGLRRSAGGWAGVHALGRDGERWLGDERVLGDGSFVEEVLKVSDEELEKQERLKRDGWNFDRLSKHVCKLMKIQEEELKKWGRKKNVAVAKRLIAYWGKHYLGMQGTEIGKLLGISKQAVSKLFGSGEKYSREKNMRLNI